MANPAQRTPISAIIESVKQGKYPFWFPQQATGQAIDYFAYGTDFTGASQLAAGATISNPINIQNDSAFCILSAVMVETTTDNLTFLAQRPLLVDLLDTGSGRHLSSTPLHADNWFGTAELPKYWDVPKILGPNSTFAVTVQNLDTVNAYTVRVAFHGFKIFGFAP